MRQSDLFTKTIKEAPKEEQSQNAKLLIRGGFVHKEMAGVYVFLPLGLRVLNKIIEIIREEMNALGGQELFLSSLQDPEVWKKSGRWDDKVVDIWFKTKLKNDTEIGLANTHEEALTFLMREFISSYRDLPRYVYQFQTKFRNELRAKSGIIRVREFIMKDLYSFSRNEKEFREFYEKCAAAYMEIFTRAGIGDCTYRTFASGGSFSKFSDEFQTVSASGEDTIYVDREKKIAINKEIYNEEVLKELGIKKDDLAEEKAIEVGNIFPLGNKYSQALGLNYKDEDGSVKPVIMGSYGIGPGRLMGTIVEIFNDERGIVWPESVAPFRVHLISLRGGEEAAEKLYHNFQKENVEVLYDDRRDKSAGEKFADADLIGIPRRMVVSEKTLAQNSVEVKKRSESEEKLVKISDVNKYLR
ncbi:MAG: prolyl-tRNA synthetase [Candidatus Nealsonbacteria bacterium]|nr:prolyl-tRNA synthetase [Candidatus Nealsonbacteria bacterium]